MCRRNPSLWIHVDYGSACVFQSQHGAQKRNRKKSGPIMRFYSLKYQASGFPLHRGKLCILSKSRIVVGVGKLEYACYLRCLQGTEVNPVSLCFRNSRNKLNEQTKDKHVEIENREVILSGRIRGRLKWVKRFSYMVMDGN